MIFVTRMDKQGMFINPDHLVSIEETPDTVLTLFNGHHFIVKESARVIIARIVAFRARVARCASGHGNAKKYLGRTRGSKFRDAMLNREAVITDKPDANARTPFHSRDI